MKRITLILCMVMLVPHSVFAVPLSKPSQQNRDTIKFYYDQSVTKYSTALQDFNDISPWDQDFGIIKYFAKRNLVVGDEGNFNPDRVMTRAEFVYIFANTKSSTLQRAEQRPFPDVATNEWYARSIAYVKGLGLVQGADDGNFYPNAPITRAAAEKILSYPKNSNDGKPLTRRDAVRLVYTSFPQQRLYPKPDFSSGTISVTNHDLIINNSPLRALFVNFVTQIDQYSYDDLRQQFSEIYNYGFRGISIEIPWVAIEPQDDAFVFPEYYDQLIQIAADEGLYVDILLSPHYTPSWLFEKYGDIYMYDEKDTPIIIDNLNVKDVPEGAYLTFSIHSPAVNEQIHWQQQCIEHYSPYTNVMALFLTNEQTYPMDRLADYSSWAQTAWKEWLQTVHLHEITKMPLSISDPNFFAFQRFRQDSLTDYFNRLYENAITARSRFVPISHKTLFYESVASYATQYGIRASGLELKGDIVGNDIYGFAPSTYAAQSAFEKPIMLVETNLTGKWNRDDMYHYLMYQYLHGATLQSVFRWNPGTDGNTLFGMDGQPHDKFWGTVKAATVINNLDVTLPQYPPNFGIIVPYYTLTTSSWNYEKLQHAFDDIYLIGDQMQGMVPSLIWSDNISVENYYKRSENDHTYLLNDYQYIFAPISKADQQAVNNAKMRDWVGSGGWLLLDKDLEGTVNWIPENQSHEALQHFGKGTIQYCSLGDCILEK